MSNTAVTVLCVTHMFMLVIVIARKYVWACDSLAICEKMFTCTDAEQCSEGLNTQILWNLMLLWSLAIFDTNILKWRHDNVEREIISHRIKTELT